MELLRVAIGDPSYQIKTEEQGLAWVRVPNYPLMNTDANGRIWLNWNTKFYKQTGMEFINNPIEAPFVIFGTTAEGITNPVPTPAGAKYPHEIQGTYYIILSQVLHLANQVGQLVSNIPLLYWLCCLWLLHQGLSGFPFLRWHLSL